MTRPIAHVDVPLPVLTLQVAAAHTASESDRLAYADYPAWAAALAAQPTYFRPQEAK
jgi:hypothetical protein